MSIGIFLLTLGLIARVTRLITRDYITRRVRALVYRYAKPDGDLEYAVSCPWCLSWWIAGGLFTLAWFYGDHPAYLIAAAAGTASYLVGILATWLDPTDEG